MIPGLLLSLVTENPRRGEKKLCYIANHYNLGDGISTQLVSRSNRAPIN